MSRQNVHFFGKGKIDHYPLEKALKLRKLLCISKGRFKRLKEEASKSPFEKKDKPKEVKRAEVRRATINREPNLGLPFRELAIADELEDYIFEEKDKFSWEQAEPSEQWAKVDEWFKLIDDYNCLIAREGSSIEKLRILP